MKCYVSVQVTYLLDTVSFVFNKSKAKALKVATQNLDKLKCFGAYGESSEIEIIEEAC